jgi:hypothetical protein
MTRRPRTRLHPGRDGGRPADLRDPARGRRDPAARQRRHAGSGGRALADLGSAARLRALLPPTSARPWSARRRGAARLCRQRNARAPGRAFEPAERSAARAGSRRSAGRSRATASCGSRSRPTAARSAPPRPSPAMSPPCRSAIAPPTAAGASAGLRLTEEPAAPRGRASPAAPRASRRSPVIVALPGRPAPPRVRHDAPPAERGAALLTVLMLVAVIATLTATRSTGLPSPPASPPMQASRRRGGNGSALPSSSPPSASRTSPPPIPRARLPGHGSARSARFACRTAAPSAPKSATAATAST